MKRILAATITFLALGVLPVQAGSVGLVIKDGVRVEVNRCFSRLLGK